MSADRKHAARKFVECWASRRGSEKGEDQQFWNSLLRDVFGVEGLESRIQYQVPVRYRNTTRFLDAWIPETKVLIEHKSRGVNLDARQEHHHGKTPFEQARDYDNARPYGEKARWIITCNFAEMWIYDMSRPNDDPLKIRLDDLPKEVHRLDFLVKEEQTVRAKELEVSVKAGRVVGKLYNSFLEHLGEKARDPEVLKNLNKLCVRLVFCVYAEDSGVFLKDQFLKFLRKFNYASFHLQLRDLFRVLCMTAAERARDVYYSDELKEFPYVGGGLFREDVPILPFSEKTAKILLDEASEQFDWGEISPTIFGAVFESTLNPETRRKGGMHYTSEENIHKVIDPLFLDALRADFESIRAEPNVKRRNAALIAFQERLGSLRFLDPACGSGNFLTETYISLRKLENSALQLLFKGQGQLDLGDRSLIHVSINQFYGIEINDFAVTVAQTAMWIAECKMMEETNAILSKNLTPLPLTDSAKIVEGNSLRLDWEENLRVTERLPDARFDYIMGNPPFIGARNKSTEQAADMEAVFGAKWQGLGNLDYVTAWYKKAVDCMAGRAAFVSTNSICQGDGVATLWKPLFEQGLEIDFAWRTFRWDSEATEKAHVHCVIVGFHASGNVGRVERADRVEAPDSKNSTRSTCSTRLKTIFDGERAIPAAHINGYLMDAPDAWIESRTKPLCNVPEMGIGNKPIDGGNYLFTAEEKGAFLKKEPKAAPYFHPWYGSYEFIHSEPRWCLWLGDCTPHELHEMPECLKRVQAVRDFRLASKSEGTRKIANNPTRFHVENMPKDNYLLVPSVSSERREYVPIGFMDSNTIASNLVLIVPSATLYHFGVLTSSVHMAWMRAVAGRLEMRYRYSANIVYNNFPWPESMNVANVKMLSIPNANNQLKTGNIGTGNTSTMATISKTAQAILDARAAHPDCSLADLYDPLTMPPDLRAAHAANDKAVLAAYGLKPDTPEPEIVAHLFKLYAKLVSPPPPSRSTGHRQLVV